MFGFTLFIIVYSISSVIGQNQKCPDCMVYNECTEATRLIRERSPDNDQILRNALCGFKGKIPMVCCNGLPFPKIDLFPLDCGDQELKKSLDSSTGLYDFPWMTLISYTRRKEGTTYFSCAGTIINSRYILTAAHCIRGPFRDNIDINGVRIGEYNLETTLDCVEEPLKECESNIQDIKIEQEIIHEHHSMRPILHDIALLRLEKEIDFTLHNAKAICLPLTLKLRRQNITKSQAKIAGWGKTDSGEAASVLVSTDIPVLDNGECRSVYGAGGDPKYFESMEHKLCAGGKGQNACAGDSGAPLMISGRYDDDDRGYRFIQYGLVSYGSRDCDGNKPGVYTDVTKYIDWILDRIQP